MQTRRILLPLAILLLLTAAAGSLVGAPDETAPEEVETSESEDRPAEGKARDDTRELRFRAGERPPSRAVPLDAHVIVTVAAPAPGEVELAGLDQLQPVAPRTPAVFDLFTDRPGRFDVVYDPLQGARERVGTLAVSEPAPADG